MDSLNLLRDARPADTELSPEAFTASRAALMIAIDGQTQGTTAPARRRLGGASRARRWGLLGGAAASVLNQAADNAVKFGDPVLKSGQYLKVSSVAEYSSVVSEADGNVLSYLRSVKDEMYIPADRAGVWVWVRHPEPPVRPLSKMSTQEFAALKANPRYTEPGEIVSGRGGAFYAPGALNDTSGWPTTASEMYDFISVRGSGKPGNERIFTWVADQLRQGQISSAERAVLYRTAALTDGVTVVDTKVELDGRTGVALRSAELRRDIILDPQTGQYIGERFYNGDGFTPDELDNWTAVTTSVVDRAPAAPPAPDWGKQAGYGQQGDGSYVACEYESWPLNK